MALVDKGTIMNIIQKYVDKGKRCMNQSINDGEGDLYTFWDGFNNCAENILREIKNIK